MIYAVLVKYKKEINPLGDIRVIVVDNSKENRGFAKGVNIGIRQALKKGAERVALINPDVKISATDVRRLEKNPADIVSPVLKFKRSGRWVYDFGGKVNLVLGRTSHYESDSGAPSTPLRVNAQNDEGKLDYVSGACLVIKKEVFEKVGLFDERFFMYFEDVDFCLRAKAAGFTMAIEPRVIIEHRLEIVKKTRNWRKIKYNTVANFLFISKWVPWYFQPTAYGYLCLITLKIIYNLTFGKISS